MFLVETGEYAPTYENSEIGCNVLHCLVAFILKLSVSILSVCLLSLFVCCVCQSVSFILCCWVYLLLCVSPMEAMTSVLARQLWSFYLWRKDFGNLGSVTWTLFLYLCICIYVFVFVHLWLEESRERSVGVPRTLLRVRPGVPYPGVWVASTPPSSRLNFLPGSRTNHTTSESVSLYNIMGMIMTRQAEMT